MPALARATKGKAFLADVEAYYKEYGVKASLYPHEYVNKLWVEDPTPAIETIKGYLAADYDFPTEFQNMVDDHQAAIEELKALVPDTATPEQREKLETAIELATRMMPLTPDHHFYIDQGTFSRMRLVLLAVGSQDGQGRAAAGPRGHHVPGIRPVARLRGQPRRL